MQVTPEALESLFFSLSFGAYWKGVSKLICRRFSVQKNSVGVRVAIATVVIVGTILYLAVTGVRANKSYYVTIQELQSMGNRAYTRHCALRAMSSRVRFSATARTRSSFWLSRAASSRSTTPAAILRPTRLRTMRRRSPSACTVAMASFMPARFRPSARPSMPLQSRAKSQPNLRPWHSPSESPRLLRSHGFCSRLSETIRTVVKSL